MLSNRRTSGTGRNNERGIALLLCIFALLLLTGIALGLMYMSDTEQAINNNYRDAQRAYFSAMAGLQEARVRVMNGAVPVIRPTTMPLALGDTGVTYIVNPAQGEAITMTNAGTKFFDDQLCHEGFPTGLGLANPGANIPCTAAPAGAFYKTFNSVDPNINTANAMDYKWVRITWKSNLSSAPYYVGPTGTTVATNPICWDGIKQLPLPAGMANCEDESLNLYYKPVYRLTSFAIAPGGSRRMLQMEVAENPPFITNAAVVSQDHVTLNGKLDVNGFDYCSCDVSDMSKCTKNADGTTSCPGRVINGVAQNCDNKKWAIYASNKVDKPNSSENLFAGPNPPYVENQPWPYNIPSLIETYKEGAITPPWTCTPPATVGANSNCGTQSGGVLGVPPSFPPSPVDNPAPDTSFGSCVNGVGPGCPQPQVTYVPGNVQLTGGTVGNGILIVDGDLDIHGGLQFYGLVLVKGVVRFTGGGSEKTNIYGAILAGQESYVDNVLGGSANIQFDVCALKQKQSPAPPLMLSFHELTY